MKRASSETSQAAALEWNFANSVELRNVKRRAQEAEIRAEDIAKLAQTIMDRLKLALYCENIARECAGYTSASSAWREAALKLREAVNHRLDAHQAGEDHKYRFEVAANKAEDTAEKEIRMADSLFTEAAECFEKAVRAKKENNDALASLWQQAAEQMNSTGENFTEAKLQASEIILEATNDWLEAVATATAGNSEFSVLYLNASHTKKRFAEKMAETANVMQLNSHEKDPFLKEMIVCLSKAIKYWKVALKAQDSGQEELYNFWKHIAKQCEKAAEYDTRSCPSVSAADGRDPFWTHLAKTTRHIVFNWETLAEKDEKVSESTIQQKRNLRVMEERIARATESKLQGDEGNAKLWLQSAEPIESQRRCSDQERQMRLLGDLVARAAEARGSGRIMETGQETASAIVAQSQDNFLPLAPSSNEEITNLEAIVSTFVRQADYIDRGAALRKCGKHEEAKLWDKAAALSFQYADKNIGILCDSFVDGFEECFLEAADRFVHAAELLAVGLEENMEIVDLWMQAATHAELVAQRQYYYEDRQIKKQLGDRLRKAAEALAAGQEPLAALWKKAAEKAPKEKPETCNERERYMSYFKESVKIHRAACEFFEMAALALADGNQEGSARWVHAAEETKIAAMKKLSQAEAADESTKKRDQLRREYNAAKLRADELKKIAKAYRRMPTATK